MSNLSLIREIDGARSGKLYTAHGTIFTPVFMPVGSQATIKALTPDEVYMCGYNILLSNTYHLYLRPGVENIKALGGLHRFMRWEGAILTDSGGYQVFSLAALNKVTDDGVSFRSHLDGNIHIITPERAVALQEVLGADIIMALDEPSPVDAPVAKVRQAMERTHRWARRCLDTHTTAQQLFAIVQGGFSPELRRESATTLAELDFPGYALGGLSLGEPKEVMWEMTATAVACLPKDKPRYLMGVGSPEDFVQAVELGIDMMDCALPTRVARNGALFTADGRINIGNAIYRTQADPVEASCDCYTCRNFSAAYMHHLFHAHELLAYRLATIHNLRFMARLAAQIRQAILEGTFATFRNDFLSRYRPTDETVRLTQKQRWLAARQGLKQL
ncbi:MAG: tRNA guanosine(34) transglycosylase Tgt [Dehalococcoidia bacterium]|nr:tRNA guanosine(34) transglycosylase Tgt [Dehalococcoidia bacterium]